MSRGRFRKTLFVVMALAFTILGTLPAAHAQHAGRVYRVGYISSGAPAGLGMWSNLLEALRELNYVEGQNLLVKPAATVITTLIVIALVSPVQQASTQTAQGDPGTLAGISITETEAPPGTATLLAQWVKVSA